MNRLMGLVVVSLVFSPATTKAQYGGYLDSGNEFLAACEGSNQEGRVLCLRYMRQALRDVYGMALAGGWTDFCLSQQLDDEALRQIIIHFLRTDPRGLIYRPPDAATMALLNASKCNKN